MIEEGFEIADGSAIECDVCIVGGGLAGLAIAGSLAKTGLRVVVLESGGESPERDAQALSAGEARIADDGAGGSIDLGAFLSESRCRALGGAGNVWGAKCARLDECDFAERDWVPDSGWPFSRRDLAPYYDRACEWLRIRRFEDDPARELDPARPPLAVGGAGARFETATRHLSPVRGGPSGPSPALREYRRAATDPANVRVILHASATEIETDASGSAARAVRAATLRSRFRVAAREIVLAAGGVENARILLLSRSARKDGLGNDRGLVGRYFGNHATYGPGARVGFTRDPGSFSLDPYVTRDPSRVWGVLALTLESQRRQRLPNFTVTMAPSDGEPDPADSDAMEAAALADRGYRAGGGPAAASATVPVYFMSEAAPNRESRLTLGSGVDALGLPRARLEWRFSKADGEALLRSARLFGRELGRESTGRVRCDWPEPGASPVASFSPSRHHIGTTRMHADPAKGVVDADCRVHGVAGLHVAGSSTLPTAGIANPTLTLIALALRLADRLEKELRK